MPGMYHIVTVPYGAAKRDSPLRLRCPMSTDGGLHRSVTCVRGGLSEAVMSGLTQEPRQDVYEEFSTTSPPREDGLVVMTLSLSAFP